MEGEGIATFAVGDVLKVDIFLHPEGLGNRFILDDAALGQGDCATFMAEAGLQPALQSAAGCQRGRREYGGRRSVLKAHSNFWSTTSDHG